MSETVEGFEVGGSDVVDSEEKPYRGKEILVVYFQLVFRSDRGLIDILKFLQNCFF